MEGVRTVRVRLKPGYWPHLHTREMEMYEGPARQLEEAGKLEILENSKHAPETAMLAGAPENAMKPKAKSRRGRPRRR